VSSHKEDYYSLKYNHGVENNVHQTVYGAVGNGSDKSSPACWCKSNPDTPQKRGAGRKLMGS
jgi:hypothetical protein